MVCSNVSIFKFEFSGLTVIGLVIQRSVSDEESTWILVDSSSGLTLPPLNDNQGEKCEES